MKKLKEFLFFPLCLVLLMVVFLVLLIILIPEGSYFSGTEYLIEMVTSEYFFSAMLITFSVPAIISASVTLLSSGLMGFLKFKKNIEITRNNFYLTIALLSSAASFIYYALFTNALAKTDQLNTTVQMTIFAVIFSIIVAIFICFIVWIIEFIFLAIKKSINKKAETNFEGEA